MRSSVVGALIARCTTATRSAHRTVVRRSLCRILARTARVEPARAAPGNRTHVWTIYFSEHSVEWGPALKAEPIFVSPREPTSPIQAQRLTESPAFYRAMTDFAGAVRISESSGIAVQARPEALSRDYPSPVGGDSPNKHRYQAAGWVQPSSDQVGSAARSLSQDDTERSARLFASL